MFRQDQNSRRKSGLEVGMKGRLQATDMRRWFLLLALMCIATASWLFRADLLVGWTWAKGWMPKQKMVQAVVSAEPVPDPESYEVIKQDLERWRRKLHERYRKARPPSRPGKPWKTTPVWCWNPCCPK